MKLALMRMMLLLTACQGAGVDAAFKDVQRAPPDLKRETAEYLVQHDAHVAVWIAETRKKCERFGCS